MGAQPHRPTPSAGPSPPACAAVAACPRVPPLPPPQVDVLHDIQRQKARGRPYVIVFCGVNGVGKSTNLAKICYWLGGQGFKVRPGWGREAVFGAGGGGEGGPRGPGAACWAKGRPGLAGVGKG